MNRLLTVAFVSGSLLLWMANEEGVAQELPRGIPPQLAPPTVQPQPTVYYGQAAAPVSQQGTSVVHYGAGPGCAPLLPTIAEGLRNTLNCLLPCRAGGGLRLGGPLLGNRRGGGLFSVRFYENCGCGLPSPRCGCGIQIMEGQLGVPVPAGDIPQVNPPKPVPDSSTYYFQPPSQKLTVPAVYHPGQLRQSSRPALPADLSRLPAGRQFRQVNHYRVSPVPNPLRP